MIKLYSSRLLLFLFSFLLAQALAAQPDSLRPKLRSFSPTSQRSGSVVTITGLRLSGVTSVRFGGVPATAISVGSDTVIKAVVGNGASGFVSVSNQFGTDSICCFTYIGDSVRPVVRRFTPLSGSTGTRVTIFGRNFFNTFRVTFGGVPASGFSVLSDTVIMLRYFEAFGRVRRAMSVMKERFGGHEDTIREFKINGGGLSVGDPLTQFHGVLRGVPTFVGQTDNLMNRA